MTADGVPFDRIVHVRGPEGIRTSRRLFDGRLALNADVTRGGDIRVGDRVTLKPGGGQANVRRYSVAPGIMSRNDRDRRPV